MSRAVFFIVICFFFSSAKADDVTFSCEAILEKLTSVFQDPKDFNSQQTYTAQFKIVTFPKNVRVPRIIHVSWIENKKYTSFSDLKSFKLMNLRNTKLEWGFTKSGKFYHINSIPQIVKEAGGKGKDIKSGDLTFKLPLLFKAPDNAEKGVDVFFTKANGSTDLNFTFMKLALPKNQKETEFTKTFASKNLPSKTFSKEVKVDTMVFRKYFSTGRGENVEAWLIYRGGFLYSFKFYSSYSLKDDEDTIMSIIKSVKYKE